MKKLALITAAMLASAATPAIAAPIIYNFSGTFTGTREINGTPTAFTVQAVFTGTGNTDNTTTGFGYSSILAVPVTSFNALSGVQQFNITTPSFFYVYGPGVVGEPNRRLGFAFDNSGNNAIGLESSAFNGYDGLSYFAQTSAPTYFQTASFNTDQGAVVITGVADGSFSAGVVPEPATWGMMMLGMGLIGAGLRSRRNSKVTTKVSFA